jgi:amidophosphoribosyltransferase
MLREAGAAEIHMRVSSPPIKHPCFYGIDFGTREELIAARKTIEEIREYLGVDSLHYITIDGMVKATGFPKEEFCLACFNEHYPIPLPRQMELGKFIFEQSRGGDGEIETDPAPKEFPPRDKVE